MKALYGVCFILIVLLCLKNIGSYAPPSVPQVESGEPSTNTVIEGVLNE